MSSAPAEILGRWKPVRGEHDGVQAPAIALEKMELCIQEDSYEISFAGKIADAGTLDTNVEGEQLNLTLTAKQGQVQGRIVPAIAQIRGDRLRICFGFSGIPPTDYSTSVGSDRYLVTYRRIVST